MMRGSGLLVAACLVGCVEGDFTEREHQAEAVREIWYDIFPRLYGEQPSEPPPPVGWREPDCGWEFESGPGFMHQGACVWGYYSRHFGYINVVWLGKMWKAPAASVPHELLHAYLQNAFGDSDGEHTSLDWFTVPVPIWQQLKQRDW